MRLMNWKAARGLAIMLALLCAAAPPLAAQTIQTADEPPSDRAAASATGEPEGEADLDARIQHSQQAFDILARSFSKKKRSELINLKTYTDAEWAALERKVAADNAACLERDAAACLAAGRAYEVGDGVWIVTDIAYILYGEACDLGLGEGCRAFHDLAQTGWGYPEGGVEVADRRLEQGCVNGDPVSCDTFAAALRETDAARADAILDKTCKAGGTAACLTLGGFLLASETPGDAEKGAAILDTACAGGEGAACTSLGEYWERQPEHDPARANRYLELACTAGNAGACSKLGQRAWAGAGLPEDPARAIRYYAKACAIADYLCDIPRSLAALPKARAACERHKAAACADLGRALLVQDSPVYDPQRGSDLLVAACLGASASACADAADAVSTYGDHDRAGNLLETGCQAGHPDACISLAGWLETRPGDTARERAVALYQRACDAGNRKACESETRFAGLVATARIPAADDTFTPPLPGDESTDLRQAANIMEICLTGSEIFRGKSYEHFACERSEKGIGSKRARPGQAPWQALLWRPAVMFGGKLTPAQRVKCGGSLIAQGWILTAAHCLKDEGIDLTNPAARADYRIRLGVFNPAEDEGVSYPILRVIPHPQFNPLSRYEFDIALIQYGTVGARPGTRRGFAIPVRTIALDPQAISQRKIVPGTPVYAFGWGWTAAEKSAATDYLQIVEMGLSSDQACAAATGFAKAFATAALCAKGKNNEQTCFGDSGGPLVYYGDPGARPVLIGVVSAGEKCGRGASQRPSQYTRIARVRKWIASHVPGLR